MVKYLGNSMVLHVETTPGGDSYALIGGSSSHTLTYNNEQVDVSTKDSSRWKELLAAGDRSVTVSMTGFVSDDANFAIMEAAVETDTILNFKMLFGNSKTIKGAFHIDSFEYTGERNAGQGFSATLTNSGAPTIA